MKKRNIDFEEVNPIVEAEVSTAVASVAEPVQEPIESLGNQDKSETKILVSHTDAYIHDRMRSQPRNVADIKVVEKQDGTHRLTLPSQIKKYEDKYTFKWLHKSKRAIDEACDLKGWTLVNRHYFSDVPDFMFTVNGSLERGDNILAFISRKKAEELRKEPGLKSKQMLEATFNRHADDPNFYIPKEKDEEGRSVIGF